MKRNLLAGTVAVALLFALLPAPAVTAAVSDIKCKNGKAAQFTCKNVDLKSHMQNSEVGGGTLAATWGWKDPETGSEYAIVGRSNGTGFIDVTDPSAPVYLGDIRKTDTVLVWVDVEVYKDHAFIVSESLNGVVVFDLARLRGAESTQIWTPDFVYPLALDGHTLRINPDSGFLYINGGLASPGFPHIIDINNPKAPILAGFITDDGYVHDSHCQNYRGPDKDHKKAEICLTQNEDSINIYDVTDKSSVQRLARVGYETASYTHSGWLTQDHKYFLMSDEGDEQDFGLPTTTYIWDVRDLDDPKLIGTYYAKTASIDHNIYIKGRYAYQASYTAGLRVLDTKRAAKGKLKETAFFDIMPETDAASFDGSWGAYPFLPSGNILVTGMGQGFFVLDVTND